VQKKIDRRAGAMHYSGHLVCSLVKFKEACERVADATLRCASTGHDSIHGLGLAGIDGAPMWSEFERAPKEFTP
jgi:hypothetical protein